MWKECIKFMRQKTFPFNWFVIICFVNNLDSHIRQTIISEKTGEYFYAQFCEAGLEGLLDIAVKIIDETDFSKPVKREGFWAYQLNTFVPHRLNVQRNMCL